MSSRNRLLVASCVFLVLLAAGGVWLRRMSVRPARTLPHLGPFPGFALPDASGRVWRNADLRGSIWIASSIPPSCGACAVTALKMADLQTSLEKARNVLLATLVSDTGLREAARLAELAREFGAKSGRWIFLSGSAGAIPEGRVCLVDTNGGIRGVFDAATPDFSSEVLDAVGDLMREGRR